MTELVDHNNSLETRLSDLEFELGVNERRLTWDESLKTGFYKHHCSTVEEVFDENKAITAMIKVFEAHFSKKSRRIRFEMPEVSTETFKDHVGPDLTDRTHLEKGEAKMITAIYGHGPAAYKSQPQNEMPEGYSKRKSCARHCQVEVAS
ncbi:hypothetical protein GJ744_008854 [Endocarpon pusillum]|uniref:Uncharacterized protein n=1 Tax=Endocarpon pusillum TaxID=364733 RepID=A0A8H7AYP6_9EURO|nr:hypothetical protein GJ744_008854 [Endocarpon pusillum]